MDQSRATRGDRAFVPLHRSVDVHVEPDRARVISKLFVPGDPMSSDARIATALARIVAMAEADVVHELDAAHERFGGRHRGLDAVLERNVDAVSQRAHVPDGLTPARRQLIGAYFTHEYAIEAAALCNPSVVPAPDQRGLGPGEIRVVMSLRAIGEGHISCIEFRSAVIAADLSITVDEPSRFASTGRRAGADHDKELFVAKLGELGARNAIADAVLCRLGPHFALIELESAVRDLDPIAFDPVLHTATVHLLRWLASSSYRLSFLDVADLSERVIFPAASTESHGMEDVRLVRFVDDGQTVYYGTYTAYDGHRILPQLIETTDFVSFRMSTLGGTYAQNKGIALFPRKVGGKFLALGRHDNSNNYVMSSTDIRVWNETALIQRPTEPWELMQLGNCGSPLETEAGWLVITHGVGPLRRYSIGALLLDLDDPTRVIGRLEDPLLEPAADEREGYVPNVVYSCGSMIHAQHLVLPYGVADVGTRVATVPLADLLTALVG